MKTEGAQKSFAPALELGGLTAEHVGTLVEMQIKRLEEGALLGLERLQAATAVRDPEGMRKFLADNAELMNRLAGRSIEDARALVQMGSNYAGAAQRICKDAFRIG